MKLRKAILTAALMFTAAQILAVSASAYLDPSAVTFSIQIIVGVVIAAGAAVGIIVTKLKKKAKDKLGIDFEKKKENEAGLVIIDDESGKNAENAEDEKKDEP